MSVSWFEEKSSRAQIACKQKKLNRVMLNGEGNENASRSIDLISKKLIARAAHIFSN